MTSFLRSLFGQPSTEARLRDIVERLEALERGQKGVRLEWEEAFDRLERLLGRLNAHLKRSRSDDPEEEKGDVAPAPHVAPASHGALLRAARARRFGALLSG